MTDLSERAMWRISDLKWYTSNNGIRLFQEALISEDHYNLDGGKEFFQPKKEFLLR
jgi:hypothetical protein